MIFFLENKNSEDIIMDNGKVHTCIMTSVPPQFNLKNTLKRNPILNKFAERIKKIQNNNNYVLHPHNTFLL